jgi:hypothetical protein
MMINTVHFSWTLICFLFLIYGILNKQTHTVSIRNINITSTVVHAYNPSYSGGGSRDIGNSRSACVNVERPYLKNKTQTKG